MEHNYRDYKGRKKEQESNGVLSQSNETEGEREKGRGTEISRSDWTVKGRDSVRCGRKWIWNW